jgi:hypothetical protein
LKSEQIIKIFILQQKKVEKSFRFRCYTKKV